MSTAGGSPPAPPPLSVSYEEWQAAWSRTLAVNLLGGANATFRAVPHLVAAGGGAVVNVTSRGAFRGEPDTPAYGASKAGLNAFAQSMALAQEVASAVVWLASPGARFSSGTIVDVNGASYLRS